LFPQKNIKQNEHERDHDQHHEHDQDQDQDQDPDPDHHQQVVIGNNKFNPIQTYKFEI
jgi:hypothetical protein